MIGFIRLYQRFLSPLLGQHCRFTPSCSQYAIEALRWHGVFRGASMACWRILRCQPFCKGGHDPVPLPAPPLGGEGNGAAPPKDY